MISYAILNKKVPMEASLSKPSDKIVQKFKKLIILLHMFVVSGIICAMFWYYCWSSGHMETICVYECVCMEGEGSCHIECATHIPPTGAIVYSTGFVVSTLFLNHQAIVYVIKRAFVYAIMFSKNSASSP